MASAFVLRATIRQRGEGRIFLNRSGYSARTFFEKAIMFSLNCDRLQFSLCRQSSLFALVSYSIYYILYKTFSGQKKYPLLIFN